MKGTSEPKRQYRRDLSARILAGVEADLRREDTGSRRPGCRVRAALTPRAAPKQLAHNKSANPDHMRIPLLHGWVGIFVAWLYFIGQIAWGLHHYLSIAR